MAAMKARAQRHERIATVMYSSHDWAFRPISCSSFYHTRWKSRLLSVRSLAIFLGIRPRSEPFVAPEPSYNLIDFARRGYATNLQTWRGVWCGPAKDTAAKFLKAGFT